MSTKFLFFAENQQTQKHKNTESRKKFKPNIDGSGSKGLNSGRIIGELQQYKRLGTGWNTNKIK